MTDTTEPLDILNCATAGVVSFSVECPVGWDRLEATPDPRKRYCGECERPVFRCHDANEAGLRAEQGECIAVPAWLAEGARRETRGVLVVGRPDRVALFGRIVAARMSSDTDI